MVSTGGAGSGAGENPFYIVHATFMKVCACLKLCHISRTVSPCKQGLAASGQTCRRAISRKPMSTEQREVSGTHEHMTALLILTLTQCFRPPHARVTPNLGTCLLSCCTFYVLLHTQGLINSIMTNGMRDTNNGCVYFHKTWLEYKLKKALNKHRSKPAALQGCNDDQLEEVGCCYLCLAALGKGACFVTSKYARITLQCRE